ncbi:MAG: peptide-methionine (S)-S-oxide reductase [Turneriella sp.]
MAYEKLLGVFWRNINPEQEDGQFYDVGSQYKTYVFYGNAAERLAAEKARRSYCVRASSGTRESAASPRYRILASRGLPPGLLQEKPAHYQRATALVLR